MSQITGTEPHADRAGAVPASAPEIVERALALSRADGCVVIATETSTVNLRWANNTLTTNGSSRDRSVTVIGVVGRSFGVRSASTIDTPGGAARPARPRERAHPAEADGLTE
ncbi:PmbA/TldA family metallopeptidase, partial [Frankia sp. AgKG'84/4]|uniref:PmbA/TldA family metallopeptidase n=1 Tax=Frankia sp. AgKG'84/4 TaxID=573490 RepID=UPI0025432812